MERRFLILQARGNLSVRIQQIRNAVRVRGLARQLPLIRHEREPKRNSAYFLFLGVDFELEQQEQALNNAFAFARSIGEQPYQNQRRFFTAEEIASMSAGKGIEVTGFWLQYKRHEEHAPPDPLDDPYPGTGAAADRTEISDRLLFWISASGSGSWERLATGAELLGCPRASLSAVLRNLILLGHVEVSLDLSRWTAAPAAVVSCVLTSRPGFLAGQRTEATLEALAETGVVLASSRQRAGDGPRRVTISRDIASSSARLGRGYAQAGVVAVKLAAKLPELSGWYASLRRIPRPLLYQRKIERWDGRGWVPYYDLIEDDTGYRGASGLYRVGRADRVSFVAHFDPGTQAWVRGDFCGLRYFDHQRGGGAGCFIRCDDNLLFLPWDCRWPIHYEKALVLASGELPSRQGEFLRYDGVPATLARTLASKLHCTVRTNFDA